MVVFNPIVVCRLVRCEKYAYLKRGNTVFWKDLSKMLKRIRWSRVAITIFFILIILVGTNYFIEKQSEAVVQKNNEKTADEAVTNVEETTLSEYPGLQLRTETTESNKYTTSISTPVAESAELNEPIQGWITSQKKAFNDEVKENEKSLSADNRAHLNIQLETKKVTDDIYSLIFTAYAYTGGANGMTTIQPFTIDVKNNHVLQLKDIMELNEETLTEVRSFIIAELKKDDEVYFYVMDELLDEALKDASKWKWSLSKKGLSLYFDEYEITAGAAGAIKIHLPLGKLSSFLSETIVNELKIPVRQEKKEQIRHQQRKIDPNGKYVALTFDDGPSAKVTPRVLAALKEHQALATFFMLGSQVEYYPEIVKQVAKAGHEIGNHSKGHPDLTQLSNKQTTQELVGTNKKIKALIGKDPTTFRPPYGALNGDVKKIAKENNMSVILWSVDSLDWKNRNAKTINQIVGRDVVPGSIILMHDIHVTTADALPELLTRLKKEGYEFLTVSELLSLENKSDDSPFFGKS